MRATLHDPSLQRQLEQDGYVAIPFLAEEEVAALRSGFEELGPPEDDGRRACHSSFHSHDRSYKLRVDALVRTTLAPHLERVFDRQRSLPCNFIVKWPGGMSGFGMSGPYKEVYAACGITAQAAADQIRKALGRA